VVDAEQVQHRGVQIADVNHVFDRGDAQFVSRAVTHPSLHSATREPRREALDVVVASHVPVPLALEHRRRAFYEFGILRELHASDFDLWTKLGILVLPANHTCPNFK